ncbi:MAG: hypothetical protein ACRC5A_12175, partial [Enterobacteriaceae bacterium]
MAEIIPNANVMGYPTEIGIRLDTASVAGQQMRLRIEPIDPYDTIVPSGEKIEIVYNESGTTQKFSLRPGEVKDLDPIPANTKTMLLRIPTRVTGPNEDNSTYKFRLHAAVKKATPVWRSADITLQPHYTRAEWSELDRSNTQVRVRAEVRNTPELPRAGRQKVQLIFNVASTRPGETVSLDKVGHQEGSQEYPKKNFPSQTWTDLPIENSQGDVILTIPWTPTYRYLDQSAPNFSIGFQTFAGSTMFRLIYLPEVPLPITSVVGNTVPPGQPLYFAITPGVTTEAGATLFLRAAGDGIDDIDWKEAQLMDSKAGTGDSIPVPDLSKGGAKIDFFHPIKGDLWLKLPTKASSFVGKRAVTVIVNGGSIAADGNAKRGTGYIDSDLQMVSELTASEGRWGGFARFNIRFTALPKAGDKLFIQSEFKDSLIEAADLDLNNAYLSTGQQKNQLNLSTQDTVYTFSAADENAQTREWQITIPIRDPSAVGKLKGGEFILAVSPGESYVVELGKKATLRISKAESTFSFVNESGTELNALSMQGSIGNSKPISEALRLRWTLSNLGNQTLKERIESRSLTGETGMRLEVVSTPPPSVTSSSCVFTVTGRPEGAFVLLPAWLELPYSGGIQQRKHNCTQESDLGLD